MARTSSTGRGRPGRGGGSSPVDRVGDSIDAAQEALKDLRGGLSKGGRDLLKDLDALLRDARKNLRGGRRTLLKDLEQVQKAAAGKGRPAAKRAPAKRTTAKRAPAKPPTAAKRTGATSARKPTGQATRAARKT